MTAKRIVLAFIASLFALFDSDFSFACAKNCFQGQVFGVSLRLEASEAQISPTMEERAIELKDRLALVMDPDCLWRPKKNGLCEMPPAQREELDKILALAATYKEETKGFFDINYDKKHRDLAGLSQGYFLDQIKSQMASAWTGDFAGDIFVAPGMKPSKPLTISDTIDPLFTFATVEMKSGGWLIGSAPSEKSRHLNKNKDIQFIIIFGSTEMLGSRIDAWATAAATGGSQVLKQLESLKPFAGKWGYAYFRNDGEFIISSNLSMAKDAKGQQVLTVNFR